MRISDIYLSVGCNNMKTSKKKLTQTSGSQFPITEGKYKIFRQKQFDLAKVHSNDNPSEVTNIYWIYAKRKDVEYPNPTKLSGKWLLFVNIAKLDQTWKVIKKATEEGHLGDFSKTATLKPSPNATRINTKVICVYTNDYTDKDDVMRVRYELKNLGFVAKISYKADFATREGLYTKQGNKNIAMYIE